MKKYRNPFPMYMFAFGLSVIMLYILVAAAMNDYQVMVYTNKYGEGLIELVCYAVIVVFLGFQMVRYWIHLRRDAIETRRRK